MDLKDGDDVGCGQSRLFGGLGLDRRLGFCSGVLGLRLGELLCEGLGLWVEVLKGLYNDWD